MLPDNASSLLQRQYDLHLRDVTPDERLKAFLAAVNDAYRQGDSDLRTVERTLEEMSRELTERNQELRRDLAERANGELALQHEHTEQAALIKKLEEAHNQLLQSEKMASIGQLAAGVAHEINNPVGFVNANLGTLRDYVKGMLRLIALYESESESKNENGNLAGANTDAGIQALRTEIDFDFMREDAESVLAETEDGVRRVRQIVQDLKDFSHVDQGAWGWANLHKGLDSTLNMANNEIKYKAVVEKHYGDMPEVQCLVSQLNQVFLNLLVNAAHAITGQGRIVVRTGQLGEQEVFVEIEDSGSGISPENLNRIFDPFFTTKPVGKGTGLGLSLAYGIVQKHHGRIEVSSEVGKGTTFRVVLPVTQPEPAASEPGSESKSKPEGRRETAEAV